MEDHSKNEGKIVNIIEKTLKEIFWISLRVFFEEIEKGISPYGWFSFF